MTTNPSSRQATGVPASATGPAPSGLSQSSLSQAKPPVPNAAAVYALAAKKAKKRYPNGTGATALADLVREAARELGYTSARKPAERVKNPNEGRHNNLAFLPEDQRAHVRRICAERTAASGFGKPCTDGGHACYTCQDLATAALGGQSERTGA